MNSSEVHSITGLASRQRLDGLVGEASPGYLLSN